LPPDQDSQRQGRKKGGIARRERLSPERRSEIAAQAAQARWSREPNAAYSPLIGEFQMTVDAIDAADMLVMELNEQMAQLSQAGASALTNGNISEAKTIIGVIEKTEDFRSRAEQLKTDITSFYSSILPKSQHVHFPVLDTDLYSPEDARTQDRTDPVLMNAKRNKILRMLESQHKVRLSRLSAAVYRTDNDQLGVVCTMSKWHAKNENYWYAYHPHQDDFLATTREGYFVLGMMDAEEALVLPVELIRDNLDKLNTTTTPDGRRYWHIHISRSSRRTLSLQRARGEAPVVLDRYVLRIL
jgi:hypothetical protein